MEGMLRREVEAAGEAIQNVLHGVQVEFAFTIAEHAVTALVARLHEAGQGRLTWGEPD